MVKVLLSNFQPVCAGPPATSTVRAMQANRAHLASFASPKLPPAVFYSRNDRFSRIWTRRVGPRHVAAAVLENEGLGLKDEATEPGAQTVDEAADNGDEHGMDMDVVLKPSPDKARASSRVLPLQRKGAMRSKAEKRASALHQRLFRDKEQKVVENPGIDVGDVVCGKVIWSNNRGARVELLGSDGIIGYMPHKEGPYKIRQKVDSQDAKWQRHEFCNGCLEVGLTRDFKVISMPEQVTTWGKGPVLSAYRLDWQTLWDRCTNIYDMCCETREVVNVHVHHVNSSGLMFMLSGLRGYVPMAHILKPADDPDVWLTQEKVSELYLHKTVDVVPTCVDSSGCKLMASMVDAASNNVLRKLEVGSLVWGTVRKVMDYGVFVGVDGTWESALLHIGNISNSHVHSVWDVFDTGDRVRAMVVAIEENGSRIALSTKVLENREGQMLRNSEAVYEHAEEARDRYLEQLDGEFA